MIDREATALNLALFGRKDHVALTALEGMALSAEAATQVAKLRTVWGRRCDLLRGVANDPEAGLSPETLVTSVAPKDD